MAKQSLTISINRELGNQAQAVFNDMGLDIATVVDYFLRQIVHNNGITTNPNHANATPPIISNCIAETGDTQKDEVLFRLYASVDDSFLDIKNATGKPVKFGGWEGKVTMADDFNAPLDDFEEYM